MEQLRSAKQLAEADLLGLLRNVRFAQVSRSFLQGTIRTWPMLQTVAGQGMLVEMLALMTPQMRDYKGVELFEDALRAHLASRG